MSSIVIAFTEKYVLKATISGESHLKEIFLYDNAESPNKCLEFLESQKRQHPNIEISAALSTLDDSDAFGRACKNHDIQNFAIFPEFIATLTYCVTKISHEFSIMDKIVIFLLSHNKISVYFLVKTSNRFVTLKQETRTCVSEGQLKNLIKEYTHASENQTYFGYLSKPVKWQLRITSKFFLADREIPITEDPVQCGLLLLARKLLSVGPDADPRFEVANVSAKAYQLEIGSKIITLLDPFVAVLRSALPLERHELLPFARGEIIKFCEQKRGDSEWHLLHSFPIRPDAEHNSFNIDIDERGRLSFKCLTFNNDNIAEFRKQCYGDISLIITFDIPNEIIQGHWRSNYFEGIFGIPATVSFVAETLFYGTVASKYIENHSSFVIREIFNLCSTDEPPPDYPLKVFKKNDSFEVQVDTPKGPRRISPEMVVALLIKEVIRSAINDILGGEIDQVVVLVPPNCTNAQKALIEKAKHLVRIP